MSKREPVYDARASPSYLFIKNGFGKVQKIRRFEKYRDLRKKNLKAYKSAFLREIIPLLASSCTNAM